VQFVSKKPALKNLVLIKAKKEINKSFLNKKRVIQLKNLLKKDISIDYKEQAKMILARHFLKKSNYKKALFYFSQIKTEPLKNKALLKQAKIYYKLRRFSKAKSLVDKLLKEDLSYSILLETKLVKLSLLLKNPSLDKKELLSIYCDILNYDNRPFYRKKAKNLIFTMKEEDILDLKSEKFIEPVKDIVYFRMGKTLFYKEQFSRAHFYLKKFLRFSTDSHLEEKTLKYLQAIESRKKVNKKYIGAILPLSGPSANIGRRSLKGLKMGLGLFKDSDFQLVVLDSEGQADKAKKAVHTLVTKHHVIAIVGGILSRTALPIAKEAQNFGVPTILMSQKSKLTKAGHYVFQNGLSPSLIVNHLTKFLIDQLKIKRFAILYPNDSYGVDYANAFWEEVEKKGGIITGVQFYKPGETDFNGPIRRLIGTYYLKDRLEEYKTKLKEWYLKKSSKSKRKKAPENILPPIVDFDVLFIPDSLKALNLIAPHIIYNDIKDIILAGPNLWNQEKILKKHSKYINSIVFSDPGLSSKNFKNTSFYQTFYRVFGSKPGLFEVQAYESALALRQIIASGADTRSELREDLAVLKTLYGPMGEITISENRELIRKMQIFKMKKNVLSPEAFSPFYLDL